MFKPFAQVLKGVPAYNGNERTLAQRQAIRQERTKHVIETAGTKKVEPVLTEWETELKRLGFNA